MGNRPEWNPVLVSSVSSPDGSWFSHVGRFFDERGRGCPGVAHAPRVLFPCAELPSPIISILEILFGGRLMEAPDPDKELEQPRDDMRGCR